MARSGEAVVAGGIGRPSPRPGRRSDRGPLAGGKYGKTLTRWQKEPDLACVRDQGELNRLVADERKEYFALWAEVATVLARTQK